MEVIKGLFKGIGFGLLAAPALYVLGFVLEILACFIPGWRCLDNTYFSTNNNNCIGCNCALGSFWSGAFFWKAFIFLAIAGAAVGLIYGIVRELQEHDVAYKIQRRNADIAAQRRDVERDINIANTGVSGVKSKTDNIVSLIKDTEKNFVSAKAKKMVEEAALEANKTALALEKTVKTADDAKGKSSKGALKSAQQANDTALLLYRDIDAVSDLYNQAVIEEQDWQRLQKEANDAVDKARNAADNAEKETARMQGTSFASAAGEDAAGKAAYALAKTKEAAAETVKRKAAAEKATSADEAQIEVTCAKNAEKRALVEEKIAVETTRIALAAG
jgi:predicted translin family RNA/ssDNA-binding protein